ncbi:MAG: Holliday junction resolvase [Methanomassiliicoccaceae archaeon]|jgi:Holliday junction resolvase|nr:Holliday junction resolvase [Methanomassiliicoccaceae archaeon]
MATAGDRYERELKYLLAGDEKAVRTMIKTCDDTERRAYISIMDNPFVVIRAAGSLGVDLVALRWDFSFPIEVKSSSEDHVRFSKNPRLGEQAEKMIDECQRSSLIPIYAFRLKGVRGDPWRIFALPMGGVLRGRTGIIQKTIPLIETNSNGNFVMRWENGMKLSKFIDYMSSLSADTSVFRE